jgi:aspartate ammonia-lyase
VSGALRAYVLDLNKIANDIRLLASGPRTGLAEIVLPAVQPGSSIMPGKVNPVLAELTAMVGFQVVGNDTAVAMAVQAGQLELNVMMPTMAHNTLQSITAVDHASDEYAARAGCSLRARDYGELGSVRVLCGQHDCAGYGAESLYRVPEGGGTGEGVGGDGTVDRGDCAGEEAAERGTDCGDS